MVMLMKITCEIIRDLIPIYIENIATNDTCSLIEEHISSCYECKNKLDEMRMSTGIPVETNISPLKKIQSNLRKRKYLTILFTVMLSLVVVAIVFAYLTAPQYIGYHNEIVDISENHELVVAKLKKPATGYDLSKYLSNDGYGYVYNITAYNSLWGESSTKSDIQNIILNPNDENVISVYYSSNDGSEDVLIYGEAQPSRTGAVLLPRLFLSYYAILAVVFALFLCLFIFLFRKNKKVANIITKILLLPLAYLLSQLCITGFNAVSYSATRDLYAIILAIIPLYCVMLIVLTCLKNRKSPK